MKKIILTEAVLVLLLAGIMTLLLWKKEPKDISLDTAEMVFIKECTLGQMEKAKDMRMKRAFSLNADDFEGYFYYAPDNTMSVDELLVLKLKDESQSADALAAIRERLSVQKRNFDGYGVDQTDLLNHAVTLSEGRYIVFAVGRDAETWVNTIKRQWKD